jgi:hypothetical protein
MYLVVHSTCAFDPLCQILDQGMTSLMLHFKFFGSNTWVHILVYCVHDPSNTNSIFDRVYIHDPLGMFPLPLSDDSSPNDFEPIITDLFGIV